MVFRARMAIAGVPADNQGAAVFDFVESVLLSAGYVILKSSTVHGVQNGGLYRHRFYRFPPNDRLAETPEFFSLIHWPGQQNLLCLPGSDLDAQVGAFGNSQDATINIPNGVFSGTWPNGSPNVINLFGAGQSWNSLGDGVLDGTAASCMVIASEWGWAYELIGSGGPVKIFHMFRPFEGLRYGRNLSFRSNIAAAVPAIVLGAPADFAGAPHLRFDVDGLTFDVTLPVGPTLNAGRLAQELTHRIGGMAEAAVEEFLSPIGDEVVVRVPQDRPPVGGYSTTRNRIALLYQDSAADALIFEKYKGAMTAAVSAGTTTLQLAGNNWVLNGIRPGATVVNRTKTVALNAIQTAIVTGFQTIGGTRDDTLVLGATAGWVAGDTYLVLPGPEEQIHAASKYGGLWAASPQASSAVIARNTPTTSVVFVLNDLLGEAQNQYEVDQSVMIFNNGLAVTLTMASVAGYALGDVVTDATSGAQGVVRHIYASNAQLVIDTTKGPVLAGTPYSGPSWANGDTVNGVLGGASTISSIRHAAAEAGGSTLGWYQRAKVTAIGQVNVAASDYRTTLTLDITGVNNGFRVSPGCIIGVMAKLWATWGDQGLFSPWQTAIHDTLDTDLGRNDSVMGANSPRFEPDYESGNLAMGERASRFVDGAPVGSFRFASLPHMRHMNGRGTLGFGDVLDEDGDANRPWVISVGGNYGGTSGLSTPGSTSGRLLYGPGGV